MTRNALIIIAIGVLILGLARNMLPEKVERHRSSHGVALARQDAAQESSSERESKMSAPLDTVGGPNRDRRALFQNGPALVEPEGKETPAVTSRAIVNVHPESRMHFVRSILRDYRNVYGQNPVGSNAEIVAALLGKNEMRSQFLRAEDRNLNERGELTDHWGTAYFLHQISGTVMEIRSAGPDKTMWTADDLSVK